MTGKIPIEITELVGLVSLNLSRNNLCGKIPAAISQLKSLDALDLSWNHLSGKIPSSLSDVTFLNFLDLSNNDLSAKIPTSSQLQSFDATAYMGNPELRGAPLSPCLDEEKPTEDFDPHEDQDEFITKGFFFSTTLGFVAGFWGVLGTLIFNNSLRYKYFKCLNKAEDWVFAIVEMNKAKLLRIIKS